VGVVIRRDSDHAHARDLVFARSADLVGAVAHDLGVAVVLMLMADCHQLRVHAAELEPDGGRVRVGYDRRSAASKPEAAVPEPGDVQGLLAPTSFPAR